MSTTETQLLRQRLCDHAVEALTTKLVANGVEKNLAPTFAKAEKDRLGIADDGSVNVHVAEDSTETLTGADPLDQLAKEINERIPATAGGSGWNMYDSIRDEVRRENERRAGGKW